MKLLPLLFVICLVSCIGKENASYTEEKVKSTTVPELEENFDRSILGEDLDEFNCYVKRIYMKGDWVLIDIDLLQVSMTPDGDRAIVNENPKIRTYIVNENTLIYLHDCESTKPEKLTEIKQSVLEDESVVVIGGSEGGILKSLNFGCYG